MAPPPHRCRGWPRSATWPSGPGVSPATVSRVLNGSGAVSAERAAQVRAAAARARLHPVGPGPGPPPAAHPGVGGDRRRHREPLLHGDGPGHGGRGPGRGPPPGAGQLRRGPREGGRLPRHRGGRADGRRGDRRGLGPGLAASTCSSSGTSRWWPSTGAPSATRTTSTPSSSTTSWAPARPPSTSLAAGARRIACITGPDPGQHRQRAPGRPPAGAARRTGVAPDADLVRRADFKEDGGYAATRTLLGGPQAARRPVRGQQPHDPRRAAGRAARPACGCPTTCCSSASTTPRGPRSSRRSSPWWPSPPTRSAARPARPLATASAGPPAPATCPRPHPASSDGPATGG